MFFCDGNIFQSWLLNQSPGQWSHLLELTYSKYLKLDELLNAQKPLSPGEHDEMLFVVIHQSYELWFKQILHESRLLNHSLSEGGGFQAMSTIKRMLVILKTIVGQIDILETMTPLSFASFRSRLDNSSGFQSAQFRQLEFYLGKKDSDKLHHYEQGSPEHLGLESALKAPTLFDHFLQFLSKSYGVPVPVDILDRDKSIVYKGDDRLLPLLLNIYQNNPSGKILCELLVDFDEGFQEWRYRHVKMVERTIGFKKGTGGSSGVSYLQKSLFQPAFPDLWNVRNSF